MRPGLQLAVFEDLDLLLDRLEARAAELQQLGAAAVAREQVVERELAGFHRGDERSELAQRHLVARGRRGGGAERGIGRHEQNEKRRL